MTVMSGLKPTQIVFDIGNVLIEWDPRHLYRKLFDDHDKMEWFLANVFTMDMNRECDRGLLFADAVEQVVARYPEWHKEIRAFDHRWAEMVPGAIEGTVELLAEIRRKKIPDHAITNFSHEKFALARQRFDFLNGFKLTIVSGEEQLLKPDAAIYHLFLERAGLKAADCVFIDDTLANVTAAQSIGMYAIHFKDPVQLRSDLRQLGFHLDVLSDS
jgi:2-haloacid dehalogenase